MSIHDFNGFLDVFVPDDVAVVVLRYVYMDESGTHNDSPAIAIAGYVFEKSQVQRFSRDWNKELKKFGVRR